MSTRQGASTSHMNLLLVISIKIKRWFFKLRKKSPAKMEMVKYWKHQAAVEAKVTEVDGVICMKMDGEKYTFPGFPRGHLLFGQLREPLEAQARNQESDIQ